MEQSNPTVLPIERQIIEIRSLRVILAHDLASLYGVATKVLNQAVRRQIARFPEDFMFQLDDKETRQLDRLRSQFVTLKQGHHSKYRPYAFTEHGAIMAATVLNSPVAMEMSVIVVRAFVRMRSMVAKQNALLAKLAELERKVEGHEGEIAAIIEAINQLTETPPRGPARQIGFLVEEQRATFHRRTRRSKSPA